MAQYVRDIMIKDLVKLDSDDNVALARKVMRQKRIHSVLIPPPRNGHSWRIFTETDLLLALDSGDDPDSIPIGAYASPITHTAHPEWETKKALDEMINNGVKHLPVKDTNGVIVGMITSTDIIENY